MHDILRSVEENLYIYICNLYIFIYTVYIYKAGNETLEIKSHPKISGPRYSNRLLDTRKCAILFCTHTISLMQSINIQKVYAKGKDQQECCLTVLNS